jgi:transcriptional regulator with XRE-family HTH domain
MAGLSQTELAAKLKTAQQNVRRREKGGSTSSTNTLLRIAKAAGTSWLSRSALFHKGSSMQHTLLRGTHLQRR